MAMTRSPLDAISLYSSMAAAASASSRARPDIRVHRLRTSSGAPLRTASVRPPEEWTVVMRLRSDVKPTSPSLGQDALVAATSMPQRAAATTSDPSVGSSVTSQAAPLWNIEESLHRTAASRVARRAAPDAASVGFPSRVALPSGE